LEKNDENVTVGELKVNVMKFIKERQWERFHNPKDLAEAICIEAAELLEQFQWITADEACSWKNIRSKTRNIGEELADVVIYCLSMANTMKIDLTEAVMSKLKKNEAKYPVNKFLGKTHIS
jgi:NTP pyrophosphatase (non-canonical NTP hydrolase)